MNNNRRADDPPEYDARTQRNGALRVPWILLIAFLLSIMGAGYVRLDSQKADKDQVAELQKDVREIRDFLIGPRRR